MRAYSENIDYSNTVLVPERGLIHASDKRTVRCSCDGGDRVMRVLISPIHIERRVSSLAERIARDLRQAQVSEIRLVVILKGAFVFATELAHRLSASHGLQPESNYLVASSYGDGARSSGKITVSGDVPLAKGRPLLVVEDIVDTGLTLAAVKDYLLEEKRAGSVKVCALMDKPAHRLPALLDKTRPEYVGFEIPDVFVAGYGLDYRELHRELPCVAVVDEQHPGFSGSLPHTAENKRKG